MRVLVTGAAGRIGRNLCDALLEQGASVRGVALPDDAGAERIRTAGVEVLTGNLRDPELCARAVDGVDAIMHLGAMLLFGKDEYNPVLLEDNHRATFNLLQAAAVAKRPLQRFVFASSDEVYPSLEAKYLPIDEEHPKNPYSFYGVTKLMSEDLVWFYQRAHNIPGAVARFSLTIEPWEALDPTRPLGGFLHRSSMLGFIRARNGDAAADAVAAIAPAGEEALIVPRDEHGASWFFHFSDVRDLVSGLLCLLHSPGAVGNAFNLAGPSAFAFDQAVPYLAKRTGMPVVDVRIPGPALRISISTAKARLLTGYAPQHDIFATFDTALAGRGK